MVKVVLTKRIETNKLLSSINMLKVIAHPIRLAIVDLLSDKSPMTVMEIQVALDLEQAIASQHLTLMEDKGVIYSQKAGRNKYVSLRFPKMKNIVDCMEDCCNSINNPGQ
ncbi:MAG: winged helix-turn-helix transcriptional regulator [Saprospiraceae bacterium]|nr:winged helix-turn-helix transcriptional regulator [Saprospiraceae bacterium]